MKTKKKTDPVQWLLCVLVLILFAVFVRNLEYLIYDVAYGYSYQTEVTTLDYYLKNEDYGSLWSEVREQQALGQETILDRSEYDAFADYYEAVMNQYRIETCVDGVMTDEERTEWLEWESMRTRAEENLTAYRFRKAMEKVREVYPLEG